MGGAAADLAEEGEFGLDSAGSGMRVLRRHALRIGHCHCRFSAVSQHTGLKVVGGIGGLIIKRVENAILLWKLEGIFLRIPLTQRQTVC
jgi:hypothetical protein